MPISGACACSQSVRPPAVVPRHRVLNAAGEFRELGFGTFQTLPQFAPLSGRVGRIVGTEGRHRFGGRDDR